MTISNVACICMTVVIIIKNVSSWFHVEVKAVSLTSIFRNTSKGTTTASSSITNATSTTNTNGSTTITNIITDKCITFGLQRSDVVYYSAETKEGQVQLNSNMMVVVSNLGGGSLDSFHHGGDNVKCVSNIDSIVW